MQKPFRSSGRKMSRSGAGSNRKRRRERREVERAREAAERGERREAVPGR